MRGKHFLALSFCALALSSCDFTQEFGTVAGTEYGEMKLTLKATADDALTEAAGGLWKSGDVLKMRLSGVSYEVETECIALAASSGGSTEVLFEGTLPSYRDSDNAYFYFSKDGQFNGTGFTKTVPSTQSGSLEDLFSKVLYYSWARRDAAKIASDGKSVEVSTVMSPMAAVLKINVPSELQATNVKIRASSPIAGSLTVNPQMGWGSLGESLLLETTGDSNEIVLESEGTVSGDVYFTIMPDSFYEAADMYCNMAQTITFSCDYYEGDMAKRYVLDDYMVCGTITDLGVLPMPKPKIPVEGGTIRMMPDATLTIGVADANADCEYYYELGSSAETCAEPTVNSTKFDPAVGFQPEITGPDDRYFIKVLANPLDTDYKGVVLTASLRNWKFTQGCPVDEIVSKVAAGEVLTAVGDSKMTSHGLQIYRNQSNALTDYEAKSDRIAFTTARVQINAITEYASDAWIGFFVDKNVSVASGKSRGYRFFYNNSQSTNSYWTESVTSAGTAADRYNMCLHLNEIFGAVKVGDKFGLRGDGMHVYYGMALLEVL